MKKILKDQLPQVTDKSVNKHGNVVVTYKPKFTNSNLKSDLSLALEKKALEARRVGVVEKQLASLQFRLSQQSDALETEKRKYLLLEQENSKLRAIKTIANEKAEKSVLTSVTKSKEFKDLVKENNLLEAEVKYLKKQIETLDKSNKKLCVDLSRILKKLLAETSFVKAKREMHLNNIKRIEDGYISGITEVIAVLSYVNN